jgi:hypothetical protein
MAGPASSPLVCPTHGTDRQCSFTAANAFPFQPRQTQVQKFKNNFSHIKLFLFIFSIPIPIPIPIPIYHGIGVGVGIDF